MPPPLVAQPDRFFTAPNDRRFARMDEMPHDRTTIGGLVRAAFMGVGVDRIDYTKGIPERFRGIEAFLRIGRSIAAS